MTRPVIAILDDEPERLTEMARCLSARAHLWESTSFDNAPDMIDWLKAHLGELRLICLDHDLGPNRRRDEEMFDPGTGRDVVDYLITARPTCPVIVHTTNQQAWPGMIAALEGAGWRASRVAPYSDLEWIADEWIAEVGRAISTAG